MALPLPHTSQLDRMFIKHYVVYQSLLEVGVSSRRVGNRAFAIDRIGQICRTNKRLKVGGGEVVSGDCRYCAEYR